jgi:ribosomal protein S18 acetylase RimI-like enzyme
MKAGGPSRLVRVRRLPPADARWFAEMAGPLLDRPADLRALRRYLLDARNIFVVAERQGRPIGFLRGTALGQIDTQRPQMFLYEIAVRQGSRRLGIGTQLIRRLLQYCRARAFDEIFVLTDPANRAAVRLYRTTGGSTETAGDRMFVYRLRPRRRPRR